MVTLSEYLCNKCAFKMAAIPAETNKNEVVGGRRITICDNGVHKYPIICCTIDNVIR